DSPVIKKREIFMNPLPPFLEPIIYEETMAFSIGSFYQDPYIGIKFNQKGNLILINDEHFEKNYFQKFSGKIYKISTQKMLLAKDIKYNNPVETDHKTRIEVKLSSVDKIDISEKSKVIFKSENIMEVVKGRIHFFIKKLKPKTKFEVNMPTSGVSVRGTEYVVDVEEDGTVILYVFDGEVEFFDKERNKVVIVKKNQQSIIRALELPSEPVNIINNKIPKWWD
ncbi:MAG: FecR family protein, partial [Endomicrobiia bacterium]